MEATVILVVVSSAALLLVLGAVIDDNRARQKRVVAKVRVELPLLHSINDDRCIGCQACVDVCPTQVLDLIHHKVAVSRFQDCVQCEQCANSCPTTALVMHRQGEQPQTLTVPALDDRFQTAVPGQYLIGEVAGKPLVKNAANLGRAVIEHIAKDLAGRPKPEQGVLDVIIVGSGPGGLSAGVTCFKRGLSYLVLEKDQVISSTVSRYPKGKHFMAEPSTAPNLSFLPVFDARKEELVGAWKKFCEGISMPIKLGEAVEGVKRRDDGVFEVKTTIATYRGRTVVLATGLRGKPRLLTVPGANLEKVQSRLEDAAEFANQDVLVVGGGDSALEAALSLSDEGARVTLSYRGGDFKRAKKANQERIAAATGKTISVLLESNVKEFTPDQVTITLKDKSLKTVPNQAAFILIGADTPVAWLENLGVLFVERPHLYALGLTEDLVRRVAPDAVQCSRDPEVALASLLGRPAHKSLGARVGDALHEVSVVMKLPVRKATQAVKRRTPLPNTVPAINTVRRAAPPPRGKPLPVVPPASEWDDGATRQDGRAVNLAMLARGMDELAKTGAHVAFTNEGKTSVSAPAYRDDGKTSIGAPAFRDDGRTTAGVSALSQNLNENTTSVEGQVLRPDPSMAAFLPSASRPPIDDTRATAVNTAIPDEGRTSIGPAPARSRVPNRTAGQGLLARPFSEAELDDAFGNFEGGATDHGDEHEFDDEAPTQLGTPSEAVRELQRRRPVRASPPPPPLPPGAAGRPLPGMPQQPRSGSPSTPPPAPVKKATLARG